MVHVEGRAFVQWMTTEDKHPAQALYYTLATRTDWAAYETQPAPHPTI